jgi:tRNA (mo5U34)-methyltransferase
VGRQLEDSRPPSTTDGDARTAIRAVPHWYHTLEIAPGVTTPGLFDLRPIAHLLPFPDVRGKRCLDVGTFDGFLAFELERRGAAEVVATDIGSHEDWDWPHPVRQRGRPDMMVEDLGETQGVGFAVAKKLLGSSAEHVTVSVYDLDPKELGEFDVVVCGSLMLHLRDPLRALERIRSVCAGSFMSAEEIDLPLTLLHPRRPASKFDGFSDLFQWFVPNAAAHRRMLLATGFSLERWTRPYVVPFGVSHPAPDRRPKAVAMRTLRRVLARGDGVPHQAVLAHR